MDELDQLKKQWQDDHQFKTVNSQDIKAMLHKSSSSIVKWIFVISVIELTAGLLLNFLYPATDKKQTVLLQIFNDTSFILFYIVIAYFMYHFFKSYRSISYTNNTATLLNSILLTRKHVENYIKFNIYFLILGIVVSFVQFAMEKIDSSKQWGYNLFMTAVFAIVFTLFTILFISIFKFYYKILYRRLLNKLNKNYEELSKLEEETE